jgi:hypothetical protein
MEIRRVAEGELTHKEFYNEYWKKGIPLVFKDASKKWKASGTFTPEFFRSRFGDRKTVVNGEGVHHDRDPGPGRRQGYEPAGALSVQVPHAVVKLPELAVPAW